MAICPTCNHDAAFGARFCSLCGTVLPRRVCQSCGTANEIESFRCIECGEALRPSAAAPVPVQADEVAGPRELGPMARLAELSARAVPGSVSGMPGMPGVPGMPSAPSVLPAATAAPTPAGFAHAPPSVIGRVAAAASPQAEPPMRSLPPPGGEDEAEAVDLYLELPRSSPVAAGGPPLQDPVRMPAPAPSMPDPPARAEMAHANAAAEGPAVDLVLPGPHRLARFAPYAIGLAAVGVGIVISGDAWLWPRSSQVREAPSPPTRPAAERPAPPVQPALPVVDDVRKPAQPPSPATAAARTAPPSERASAAAPRRGDGVDAAADAALAAAERALAAQARPLPAPTTARPAAQPRPGASSATPRPPPGDRSADEGRKPPASGGPSTAP